VEKLLASGPPGRPRTASWDAIQALMRMELRGNVRELKNLVERARAMTAGPEITAHHLEVSMGTLDLASKPSTPLYTPPPAPTATAAPAGTSPASLEGAEREVIESTLKACGYHRERAAEKL